MKILLAFFLSILLLTISPAQSEEKQPFLAVFAVCGDMDAHRIIHYDWDRFKPDLLVESNRWTTLAGFIQAIKKQAKDRPVVIDIDCHGSTYGYLATSKSAEDECDIGYLLNKIETLPNKKVVCLEACYASICYSKGMASQRDEEYKSFHFESYKGAGPDYPIYGELVGGKSIINFNNLTYLQYRFGICIYITDLRDINDITELVDSSKESEINLRSLLGILRLF